MAGSHHTGRRPSRLSSISRRDSRATGDRRRVAEADIRSAIYVRPLGAAYDVVKNICNDQEYVVANATGATHTAGQVVPLGSFTGNPGEFTFGRPPAGYGGASAYAITPVRAGYGYATSNSANPVAESFGNVYFFATDPSAGMAYWLVGGSLVTGEWGQLVVGVPISALPMTASEMETEGTVVGVFQDVGNGPVAFYCFPGPRFLVIFQTGSAGSNDASGYVMASMSDSGIALASTSYVGPDITQFFQNGEQANFFSCVAGGKLFISEPREDDPVFSSPPPEPVGGRIANRNAESLAIPYEYEMTSVSTFDGSPSRGQIYLGLAQSGSELNLYFENYESVTKRQLWRTPLSQSLVAGASVKITNSGAGSGQAYRVGEHGLIATAAGAPYAVGRVIAGNVLSLFSIESTAVSLIGSLTQNPSLLCPGTATKLVAFDSYGGSAWIIETDGTEHLP